MILRRLTEQLKQLHGTAIGVELVIVVFGVFIGMQVSNWNANREDEQKAAAFSARLKADLRALEGEAGISDEELLVSAYRATQYKEPQRHRSSYDELISTGTIGLIRDQILRDTAMRLYSVTMFDNFTRDGRQSRYREAFRMSLPNAVQDALNKQCGDHFVEPGDNAGIHGVLDYPCRSGLSAQVIAESAKALRSNPELLQSLRLRIADIQTRLGDMTSNNRRLMNNLRTIAVEKP